MVVVCPDADAGHQQLAVRLKAGGLRRVMPVAWDRFALSLSSCTVTVEHRKLTQVHTGASRLIAQQPGEMTQRWLQAARQRSVVLALVPPGTLPADAEDQELDSDASQVLMRHIDAVAERGKLLAGLARLLDEPAPAAGSGTRQVRLSDLR